ncbi:MAG: alcohol dehydrogenase catalytic domain-containing protein [Chloroflexota bacterium]|nr:alcohol dehydrogenase catalytic domain-containing protein [Chloroflexota bacterium]MDE2908491.1 alcohol dehydrogenase catalytic domain-containing protein [Chloroflexota bacterium]
MKAALLQQFGQGLTIADVPVPQHGSSEALVRVRACGIDGTDLKLLDGFGYTPDLPFIMGHEIAGDVVAVGADVSAFAPGDRVAVYNFITCGACTYCRRFRDQLCQNMSGIVGVLDAPGGYADYVCLPAQQLIRLPAAVSYADGATCCDAGMTALHAIDRADVNIGDTVLVIGIGGVGSIVTQLLAASGADVIAVDIDAAKEQSALDQGAFVFLRTSGEELVARVRGLSDGDGVDRVIDVVGLESTMTAGFASLRRGGRLVAVGYTPESFPLSGKELAQNEKEVIGARAGRRDDLRRCLDLYANGKLTSIVRQTYALDQVNQALAHLRAGVTGRIVLTYE